MRRLGQLLAWLVILGVGAVLVSAVLVPRLAGATPYTVLSGSMEPGLRPGSLVVVKPVDPQEIGVGSIITYQLVSGERAFVTHRVVAQSFDSEGAPLFRTQGDANDVPDVKWVRPVQVKGELWYSVPYLGYVNDVIGAKERQVVLFGVIGFLLLYALYMFTSAALERRRLHPHLRERVRA